MKCGLLGQTLGHSYSPEIHAQLGEYAYSLFEKEPEEVENFLKNGDFTGINVTIPYKKAVIPFLDELSPKAAALGAVNTIVRRPNGRLIGHNTDYFGFETMVNSGGFRVNGKKVLVLGSGGASNTASAVLRAMGAETVVISRTGADNYGNLSRHRDATLIVNTTPVGMFPNVGKSPISLDNFPHLEGVWDVIFNPARTQFLLDGEKRGLKTMNGLKMLAAQAKESAEWFTGRRIPDGKIDEIYEKLSARMQNIVLIGMPGCGKSTVGAAIAEKTGRIFADADEEIVRLAGKSIPEIFAEDGEAVFRNWETQALARLGRQSALVIATGGGCVTKAENYPLLHQNGIIFWLKRDISALPTEGRPLSKSAGLAEMYARREPLYRSFADKTIANRGKIQGAADEILAAMEENL